MKLVYKVVCVGDTGNYTSCLAAFIISLSSVIDPFMLVYKINKKTTPKIGRIFCFKTLENAKTFEYTALSRRSVILEGSYTGKIIKVKENFLPGFHNFVSNASVYWKNKKLWLSWDFVQKQIPTVKGTILVRDFTPLRIVYN